MRADPKMVKVKGGYVCAVDATPLNDVTVKNQDPFCSAGCANVWHEFEPSSRRFTLGGNPADQQEEGS